LTTIDENEVWKINFFEGVPSPAAAGLVLLPLILNLSGLIQFENYAVLSSVAILTTSVLMVSKIPTYSLKRILIPRHLAVFLLLGIGIYVSLLIFYTFETLFFTGTIYLLLIPISVFHYGYKNKKAFILSTKEEDEDVL
jgi:CDP-diacylglycerol--serine O-phosphatidyltransferase